MKNLAAFVLFFACLAPAVHADTQGVNFTFGISGDGVNAIGSIVATPVSNPFWLEWGVDSITGTFNGLPITGGVPGFGGPENSGPIGAIFDPSFGLFMPLPDMDFMVNGNQIISWVWFSGDVPGNELVEVVFANSGQSETALVTDSIIDPLVKVPEPGAFILMASGLLGIFARRLIARS